MEKVFDQCCGWKKSILFFVFSGRFSWNSGSVFEGEFKNGMKHGKGMSNSNKRRKQAASISNVFGSIGQIWNPNGETVSGEWEDDKMKEEGKKIIDS